jgi:hypothetical protein
VRSRFVRSYEETKVARRESVVSMRSSSSHRTVFFLWRLFSSSRHPCLVRQEVGFGFVLHTRTHTHKTGARWYSHFHKKEDRRRFPFCSRRIFRSHVTKISSSSQPGLSDGSSSQSLGPPPGIAIATRRIEQSCCCCCGCW